MNACRLKVLKSGNSFPKIIKIPESAARGPETRARTPPSDPAAARSPRVRAGGGAPGPAAAPRLGRSALVWGLGKCGSAPRPRICGDPGPPASARGPLPGQGQLRGPCADQPCPAGARLPELTQLLKTTEEPSERGLGGRAAPAHPEPQGAWETALQCRGWPPFLKGGQ